MKFAIISDSHTLDNNESIIRYLRKNPTMKLNGIILNGDILGENEVREGYGYNYNRTIFMASLDKLNILKRIDPTGFNKLLELQKYVESGTESSDIDHSETISNYVRTRYETLFKILTGYSDICTTYFNPGCYESPLHYKVLDELAFLLETNASIIKRIALLSNYRNTYKEFLAKLTAQNPKKLGYIGGSTKLIGDTLLVGIPGLNANTVPTDAMSEFQEKLTKDLLNTTTRQLSYCNKLIIFNATQGKLRKDPFGFRPASQSVREFIETLKGKLRQKVFVQSYHHFSTTHFYEALGMSFVLNNSAVNNGLFNLIELGTKINCYDVDCILDKTRKLSSYNYDLADYNSPEDRLKLNYPDALSIIKERNLAGCYYM